MAASTLQSLLIKIGFDVSDLAAGVNAARTQLGSIAQAARNLTSSAAPASAAITSIGAAATSAASSTSGLVAGLQSANGAIAATTKSAGQLVAGYNSANGAMARTAATTGQIVAGFSGANGAMAAAASSTGPLITGVTSVTAAMNGAFQASGPLITNVRTLQGAMAGAAAAAGPLVAGIQGANGPIAAAAPAANLAAIGFQRVAIAGAHIAPPVMAAAAAVGGLNAQFNGVPGPALRASNAMNTVATAAKHVSERSSFMNRTLSMAFAFSGGVAITNLMGFLGNAILGFNSRLEQAHIAFTTLLGDADKADAYIETMKKFAEVTPYEFPGLQDAVQRLLAMGFTAEQAIPTLRVVGDTVAALGGSADKLDRVTIALGQMMTAGRVNAQDMRQLTEAGIPAWQMLADAIGKTVAETRKLAEEGLIPSNVAIEALLSGMQERFGGMMAQQARTAQGAFSTIRDAAIQTISGAVEPLFNALSQVLVGLADFFINGGGKMIVPAIQAIGIAIGVFLIPKIYGAAQAALAASAAFGTLVVPIYPLIIALTTLGLMWQENIGGIRTTLGPVISQIADFAKNVLEAAAKTGLLIPIIVTLATVITVKFVASLVQSAAAMLWNAATAVIMGNALKGLTVDTVAAAGGSGVLRIAMIGVAAVGGVVVAAIAAIGAAVALFLMYSEQVLQGIRVIEFGFLFVKKAIADFLADLPLVGDAFKGFREQVKGEIEALYYEAKAAQKKIDDAAAAAAAASTPEVPTIEELPFEEFIKTFQNGTAQVQEETRKLVDIFGTTMEGVVAAARDAGGEAMSEMAKGIKERQDAPLGALKTLKDMLADEMDPMKEIARLYGILQSTELAAGMASGDAAVRAQAEATRKLAEERLAELTNGAYQVGASVGPALAQGIAGSTSSLINGPLADMGVLVGMKPIANLNAQGKAFIPTAQQIADAMNDINAELYETERSAALSALSSAFGEIRRAAMEYFSEVHEGNLKAIQDARDHKNALLDAKAALNQAPVTAAQGALDFRRQQIQEFRLREAIRTANSPEAYRDAVLALEDFLAQKHIDAMQAQVDAANEKIDKQKEANDRQAEAQRDAENRRYEDQKRSFERQLQLLQEYLEKHPGEWSNTQKKVLGLLQSYGFSYNKAGKLLGADFVAGLRENLTAAEAAGRALAAAGVGANVPTGAAVGARIGLGGVTQLAHGEWEILKDNTLASLHKGEMVVPASAADLVRAFASRRIGGGAASPYGTTAGGMESTGGKGGGTIILQIGDEKLAELTDQSLYVQDSLYGTRKQLTLRSMR